MSVRALSGRGHPPGDLGSVFTEPDDTFRSTQIEDPDGNILQLFERLGDD